MATFDHRSEDVKIEGLQRGSIKLVIGWGFLLLAFVGGLLVFQTYRDGTHLWRYMVYAAGVIGLVMVMLGSHQRRLNS